MWLADGAAMPFHATAKVTVPPWMRMTSTARPSLSPTFLPSFAGTSFVPFSSAATNTALVVPVTFAALSAGAPPSSCSLARPIGATLATGLARVAVGGAWSPDPLAYTAIATAVVVAAVTAAATAMTFGLRNVDLKSTVFPLIDVGTSPWYANHTEHTLEKFKETF